MIDAFSKNSNDEYIEGYLSDKENFNGVLFLLKEPNTNDGEQESFWFKDGLEGKIPNSKSKRVHTLYKNKFEQLLDYIGFSGISSCAYANIIPNRGFKSESSEYKSLCEEFRYNRFKKLIETCNPQIVFLCTKDFEAIIKIEKGKEYIEPIENEGIQYSNNKQKRAIHYKDSKNDLRVYEIYHPGYRIRIEEKDK